MEILTMLSVFCGMLVLICYALLFALLKSSNRIIETNRQLMLLVAGKDNKPETLRALVASQKPPQGKLKGIATKKNKDKKPANTNYTMSVGS